MNDLIANANSALRYHANFSSRTLKRLETIQNKLYAVPMEPLTTEELFELRDALLDLRAASDLTQGELARLDEARQPKPTIFTKIFNK